MLCMLGNGNFNNAYMMMRRLNSGRRVKEYKDQETVTGRNCIFLLMMMIMVELSIEMENVCGNKENYNKR